MGRPAYDRVETGSLPAALSALCCSLEGQGHPWTLGFMKNLTQRVVTLQQVNDDLRVELSAIYRRLCKLEARQHDA